MTVQNVDGVINYFGPRDPISENINFSVHKSGEVHELVTVFSYDNLPVVTSNNYDPSLYNIPANSIILSAWIETLTPFTIATSTPLLDIGLTELDGTAIDADGLFADVAVASMSAVGERVIGAGALIGTSVALTSYLNATVSGGTHGAGKLRLVIRYSPPDTAEGI
jgi:hypothetical protein